jgi:hypothetical protein
LNVRGLKELIEDPQFKINELDENQAEDHRHSLSLDWTLLSQDCPTLLLTCPAPAVALLRCVAVSVWRVAMPSVRRRPSSASPTLSSPRLHAFRALPRAEPGEPVLSRAPSQSRGCSAPSRTQAPRKQLAERHSAYFPSCHLAFADGRASAPASEVTKRRLERTVHPGRRPECEGKQTRTVWLASLAVAVAAKLCVSYDLKHDRVSLAFGEFS